MEREGRGRTSPIPTVVRQRCRCCHVSRGPLRGRVPPPWHCSSRRLLLPGKVVRYIPIWKLRESCPLGSSGRGTRKGKGKALPGLTHVPLRDTEFTWPGSLKECRCPTWPQMDFTGSLFLAVFTSTLPSKPPLPPQRNQVHLEAQRAWPPLTPTSTWITRTGPGVLPTSR